MIYKYQICLRSFLCRFSFSICLKWILQRFEEHVEWRSSNIWLQMSNNTTTRQIHSLCYRNSFLSCAFSFPITSFAHFNASTQNAIVTWSFFFLKSQFFSFFLFFFALFMLLHLFTFRIPFDFLIFFFFLLFCIYSMFLVTSFHCVHTIFVVSLQNVSDLEMPSISFNWTFIQKLSTRLEVLTFKYRKLH